jgi:hypothetical protein
VEDLKEAGHDIKKGAKNQYYNIKDKAAGAIGDFNPKASEMRSIFNWVFGSGASKFDNIRDTV